jgi:hypothetical protein
VSSYSGEVKPGELLNGEDNFPGAPELDIPAADEVLKALGYRREGDWVFSDDIWGAVVTLQE